MSGPAIASSCARGQGRNSTVCGLPTRPCDLAHHVVDQAHGPAVLGHGGRRDMEAVGRQLAGDQPQLRPARVLRAANGRATPAASADRRLIDGISEAPERGAQDDHDDKGRHRNDHRDHADVGIGVRGGSGRRWPAA